MRHHTSSGLVALAVTLVLYALLRFTLPADAWFKVFLYERSLTQWVAIAMFVFGADQLVFRWRLTRRERRLLGRVRWPSSDEVPPAAASASGWVARRYDGLDRIARQHSPAFTRDAARTKSEEDARELAEGYVLTGDVVGLLPLVGFFGTVLGLSQGLYNNFVLQGEDSTSSFANAIGTAFDTTLLALFLTIVLSVLQSLVRRGELALLEDLDRRVERGLTALETEASRVIPAANDPRVWLHELGIDPAEMIGFLREKLGGLATQAEAVSSFQPRLIAALDALESATSRLAGQAVPDPRPQLENLATALADLRSLQTASQTELHASGTVLGRIEHGLTQSLGAALAALEALAAANRQATAANAAATQGTHERLDAVSAGLTQQTAALQHTAEQHHRASATQLTALGEHLVARLDQHQAATQELINRPRAFTVTERPAPEHAPRP